MRARANVARHVRRAALRQHGNLALNLVHVVLAAPAGAPQPRWPRVARTAPGVAPAGRRGRCKRRGAATHASSRSTILMATSSPVATFTLARGARAAPPQRSECALTSACRCLAAPRAPRHAARPQRGMRERCRCTVRSACAEGVRRNAAGRTRDRQTRSCLCLRAPAAPSRHPPTPWRPQPPPAGGGAATARGARRQVASFG